MTTEFYSHRSGSAVVQQGMQEEIKMLLGDIECPFVSQFGEAKKDILQKLENNGWFRDFKLDVESKISVSLFRDRIGLCFQTGNVARIYADLLKLQTLFLNERISAGIIMLPLPEFSRERAANTASFNRLVRELSIFSQVLTVPLVVIGFRS